MPKVFFRDFNFVLSDVITSFETTDDYASADAVVCWNDIEGECREVILNANYLGIPTLVMQHGIRASHEYAHPYNAPLIANKIMVWGTKDKERVLFGGLDESRVIVTGTTLFDHLIPKQEHNGTNIVFLPMHWDSNLEENIVLARKLREIKGVNIITKLIEGMDGSGFDNPIYSYRHSHNHLDVCASLLSTADLVVGINEGTFEFLAYARDIPVLVVDLWKPKFFGNRTFVPEISPFFSDACQKTSLDNLQIAIKSILNNPSEFSAERKKALREYGGVGLDETPARSRIVNAINSVIGEGHKIRLQPQKMIVEYATRNLMPQIKLKEIKSQQLIGGVIKNLEEVKQAKQELVKRELSKINDESEIINPLEFSICFAQPTRLAPSAWTEHVPFAMFLVDILKPKVIVELGTHYGVSYCAFCQAVKTLGLDSRSYAVDTWKGDEHSDFYEPKVLEDLRKHHDPLYGSFSRLISSTFDEAIKHFEDSSIDLLHIDGYHTYETVKHDFQSWVSKVSPRGVILLHDINVREQNFGVWKLWLELKEKYRTFEFTHAHGLGLVAVGNSYPKEVETLLASSGQVAIKLREFFYRLGSSVAMQKEVAEREQQVEALTGRLAERDGQIGSLNQGIVERDGQIGSLNQGIVERDGQIGSLNQGIVERDGQIGSLNQGIVERDGQIASLSQAVAEREGQGAALYNSHSWRITAPLRVIGTKFRRMINRIAITKAIGGFARTNGFRAGWRLFKGRRWLLSSGAFDVDYYLRQNPDVAAARIDPALHFMMHCVREGRNANAFFDTNWYLEQNPDVAEASLNPLVHYIQFGADEGRDPSPRFSSSAYLAANPDVAAAGINPLLHYLKFGMTEGRLLNAWNAREALAQRGQEIVSTRVSNELSAHLHSIDVIVCVHNALEDVKLCLESVVANTLPPYRLIIVDDGSDHETQEFLEKVIVGQPAMLIRNEIATGYTRAANTGLRASSAEMVVLLNSDTIVPPRWLDRLVRCASSDDNIGLVGPLSNTASWQSVPQIFNEQGDWADNLLPEDWSVKDFSNEVAQTSQCIFPRVGFLNGFCLLIKRAVINDIGLFDEVTFAHGYSEENDYCLRAVQKNWQLAVADDCFVFHAQSKSYTHDRRQELVSLAGKALVVKHGQERINAQLTMTRYHPALEYIRKRCKYISYMRRIRDEMLHRFEGKRVLFLLPVGTIGGGGNIVLLECATMREIGVDAWIANLLVNRELFEQHHPNLNVPVLYLRTPEELLEYAQAFDAVIATLYLTVFWMKPLLSLEQRPRLGYYIQDFEPYFFQEGSSDYQQALSSYSAIPGIYLFTKTKWNCSVLKEKLSLAPVVIGPSLNVNAYHPSANYYRNLYPVRIVAMVRPSTPRRAPEMTMRVLKRLKQRFQHQIVISIFGVRCDDPDFLKLEGTFAHQCLGELTAEKLKYVLMHSDIFVDCSTFQAMGLTAMEAMASGTVVVGPLNGGLTEIVENEKTGLLIDTQDEDQIISAVSRLIENYELRHRMCIDAFDVLKNAPILSVYRLLTYLFCEDE